MESSGDAEANIVTGTVKKRLEQILDFRVVSVCYGRAKWKSYYCIKHLKIIKWVILREICNKYIVNLIRTFPWIAKRESMNSDTWNKK